MIESIIASEQPGDALLRALEQLDARRDLETQAAVFEAVMWRAGSLDYWVWYRMSRVYADLGRGDLGFVCSVKAVQLHPDWEASALPYRDMFRYFRARGDVVSAVAVARQQRRHVPNHPVGSPDEIEPLFRELGLDPGDMTGEPDGVFDRLASVLRATFRQPDLEVRPETTSDDVQGWDSLAHARLRLEVERAFGITFAPEEALDPEPVGALAALVARKTRRRAAAGKPKLILYGNCQAGALGVVLTNTPAITARYDVVVHDLWATGETLARNLEDFADAEGLLQQDLRNWDRHPLRDALPAGLPVVRFPFCYVAALWPFDAMLAGADEAMLRAMQAARERGEEFPFGFQDGLLARLRELVPDPEARLRRYRDLDIPDPPDIRRVAAAEEARLLADDARLGCTIGRHIAEHYRSTRLFHAIAHPTAALIGRLAAELVTKLGIGVEGADLATYDDYMGHYQVPLHPRVIRDLGIAWADPSTRYEFHRRERLTFEEYYRRYIATAG